MFDSLYDFVCFLATIKIDETMSDRKALSSGMEVYPSRKEVRFSRAAFRDFQSFAEK